jgi:hypothetical protein
LLAHPAIWNDTPSVSLLGKTMNHMTQGQILISRSILFSGLRWICVRGFASTVGRFPDSRTGSSFSAVSRRKWTDDNPWKEVVGSHWTRSPLRTLSTRLVAVDDTEQSPSKEAADREEEEETWLVVGDGDLSFSAGLARELASTRGTDGKAASGSTSMRLIASVLENQDTHRKVYNNSNRHTGAILSCHANNRVSFGVDATQLSTHFPQEQFERIIFNFPHWRGKANNRYNRQLLDQFLQSAVTVLKKNDGEIHIALCQGQGGVEATTIEEWRRSWMVHMYAAQHGLLLRRVEPFQPAYDLSSRRGFDHSFSTGDAPLRYVFAHPDGQSIERNLRIAFRHELRIVLDPETLSTVSSRFSEEELIHGSVVPELVQRVVPDGVYADVPLRYVVTNRKHSNTPLLIFLVVYAGERHPLKRSQADTIRAALEKAATEKLGFDITKRDRLVSKPFPLHLLDTLIRKQVDKEI